MSITIKTYDIPQESRNGRIYTNGSATSSSSSSSVSVGGITDLSNYYTSGQTDNAIATALSLQSISGTTSVDRTYLGYQAGKNFSGNTNYNTFIGAGAGYGNIGGYCNTYVGHNAAYNNNGSRNVFIGFNAGTGITNLSDTLYINNSYGFSDTPLIYGGFYLSGFQNAFLKVNGNLYLPQLNTGTTSYVLYYNPANGEIIKGAASGTALIGTTSYYNTFLGRDAGRVSSSTGYNTMVGFNAGYSTTNGMYNTFLGQDTGYNNVSGSSNVFLGYQAGRYNTGSDNLYIDNQSRTNEATQKTYALIYGKFSSLPANQTLTINGNLFVNGMSADATPTNIVYYNTTTKKLTYGAAGGGNYLNLSGGTITGSLTVNSNLNVNGILSSNYVRISNGLYQSEAGLYSEMNDSEIATYDDNNGEYHYGGITYSSYESKLLSYNGLFTNLSATTLYTSGTVRMNNLTSATKTSVIYYDTTTKQLSYGATPSGGGGAYLALSGGTITGSLGVNQGVYIPSNYKVVFDNDNENYSFIMCDQLNTYSQGINTNIYSNSTGTHYFKSVEDGWSAKIGINSSTFNNDVYVNRNLYSSGCTLTGTLTGTQLNLSGKVYLSGLTSNNPNELLFYNSATKEVSHYSSGGLSVGYASLSNMTYNLFEGNTESNVYLTNPSQSEIWLMSDISYKVCVDYATDSFNSLYLGGVVSSNYALKTDLNTKLSLTGGTMTGGLSGTTLYLNNTFQHSGSSAGFYGKTPTTKPTAITAINSTVISTTTYGSAVAGVINNNRTRINEIYTRLQTLGLIT